MAVRARDTQWLQFDPFAGPAWRWCMAERIAAGEMPYHRGLDDALRAAVLFRRRERGDTSPGRRRRQGPSDAAIGEALELHTAGGLAEWELRARLLSGQDDQQIAERCGLTPETVGWYFKLFFDVRDKLQAPGYIMSHVIGYGPWSGFPNDQVGRFWGWMGWAGGPQVLDVLIDTFHAVRRPRETPTLGIYLRRGVDLPCQCLVGATVLPRYGAAGVALTPLMLGLVEARASHDPAKADRHLERVQRGLVRLARQHLAGKPITVRPPAKPQKKAKPSVSTGQGNQLPKTFMQDVWDAIVRRSAAARARTADSAKALETQVAHGVIV